MIKGLSIFMSADGLPQGDEQIMATLQCPEVKHIICCCLGPKGTNIGQAAGRWIEKMGLTSKTEIRFFATPEASLVGAKEIEAGNDDVVGIFWTCAVYARESTFFFTNPDALPFFTQEIMPLDQMQLATRPELVARVQDGVLPVDWRIASHPSPQFLVTTKLVNQVVIVNSNSAAAKECSEGRIEACVTTEQARQIYGLETLHIFGSPPMVFFGGITKHGAGLISKTWQQPCVNVGSYDTLT